MLQFSSSPIDSRVLSTPSFIMLPELGGVVELSNSEPTTSHFSILSDTQFLFILHTPRSLAPTSHPLLMEG